MSHQTATLVLQRDWATLVAEGPDSRSWLNGLITCDVGTLPDGGAAWGLILTRTGKIQSPVVVVGDGARLLIAVPSSKGEEIGAFFDERLIMEDVELQADSGQYVWATAHGAGTAAVSESWKERGALAGRLSWTRDGDAVAVASRDLIEEGGAWVTPLGDTGRLGSAADWDAVRVPSGFPEFGVDFDEHHNPHEAGLERRAVSWTKGCYVGQEVVCMQDMRGRVRRRITLLRAPAAAIEVGASVVGADGEETAGTVTSAARCAGGDGFALAMLNVKLVDAGSLRVGGSPIEVESPRF